MQQERMNSEVMKVDWANLRACNGSAESVGKLLKQIYGPEDLALEALNDLFALTCHQGTAYECSPSVQNILVPMLQDLDLKATLRTALGELVLTLAIGPDYELLNSKSVYKQTIFESEQAAKAGNHHAAWRLSCYQSLEAQVPAFFEDAIERPFDHVIAYIGTWFPAHFKQVMEYQLTFLGQENFQSINWCNCVLNIGVLEYFSENPPSIKEMLESRFDGFNRVAKSVAACYLFLHNALSPVVVKTLVDLAESHDIEELSSSGFDFYGGNLALFAEYHNEQNSFAAAFE